MLFILTNLSDASLVQNTLCRGENVTWCVAIRYLWQTTEVQLRTKTTIVFLDAIPPDYCSAEESTRWKQPELSKSNSIHLEGHLWVQVQHGAMSKCRGPCGILARTSQNFTPMEPNSAESWRIYPADFKARLMLLTSPWCVVRPWNED